VPIEAAKQARSPGGGEPRRHLAPSPGSRTDQKRPDSSRTDAIRREESPWESGLRQAERKRKETARRMGFEQSGEVPPQEARAPHRGTLKEMD
jgi:hypothetical protein